MTAWMLSADLPWPGAASCGTVQSWGHRHGINMIGSVAVPWLSLVKHGFRGEASPSSGLRGTLLVGEAAVSPRILNGPADPSNLVTACDVAARSWRLHSRPVPKTAPAPAVPSVFRSSLTDFGLPRRFNLRHPSRGGRAPGLLLVHTLWSGYSSKRDHRLNAESRLKARVATGMTVETCFRIRPISGSCTLAVAGRVAVTISIPFECYDIRGSLHAATINRGEHQ